jgi:type IV secretion system protein VirD4
MKYKKSLPYIFLLVLGATAALYFTALMDSLLRRSTIESYQIFDIIRYVASNKNALKLFLVFVAAIMIALFVLILSGSKDYQSAQIIVTPDISIPVPAGQGQCGTARWLSKKDFDSVFRSFTLDSSNEFFQLLSRLSLYDIENELNRIMELEQSITRINDRLLRSDDNADLYLELIEKQKALKDDRSVIRELSDYDVYSDIKSRIHKGDFDPSMMNIGGVVYGKKDLGTHKEQIYFNHLDTHTLILGATRSGKDRTIVMQTIGTLALAGESMIITDPKPEELYYNYNLLKLLDYNIITIDFKNPKKSTRFNYLQQIIDFVDDNNLPSAIDATWDLVAELVGEPKGERLWNDGEASMIAAGTMAVIYDNRAPENHKYQNLTNVFYFISQMCTPVQVGNVFVLPLNKYVQDIPIDHPSKGLLSVSEIAPSRTRGSFYTSALMTLRLFTNPLIADMTSQTDYDPMEVGRKKTAIFIILPDDRKTYYSLASLYCTQQYQMLSKAADIRGGRLTRRTNFILNEFGNFTKITIFTAMQTVGGGKGIRFNIFVQDYKQIDDVYEATQASIIRSNCENWIYLQTDDPDTLKGLSDKLGKYTISTYSLGSNHQKFSNPSSSHNISLTGRELLAPDEIKKIRRPYSLVTSRSDPAILYSPDVSKWYFNTLLGLGNEEHNRLIRLARENIRPQREVRSQIELWGIWDEYKSAILKEQEEKEAKAMQMMANQFAMQSQLYDQS